MKWKILKENENYSINEKGEIKNNITKKVKYVFNKKYTVIYKVIYNIIKIFF